MEIENRTLKTKKDYLDKNGREVESSYRTTKEKCE